MGKVNTSISIGVGDEDIYALSQLTPNFTRLIKNLCRKEIRRNSELKEAVEDWVDENIGYGDLDEYLKRIGKTKSVNKVKDTTEEVVVETHEEEVVIKETTKNKPKKVTTPKTKKTKAVEEVLETEEMAKVEEEEEAVEEVVEAVAVDKETIDKIKKLY